MSDEEMEFEQAADYEVTPPTLEELNGGDYIASSKTDEYGNEYTEYLNKDNQLIAKYYPEYSTVEAEFRKDENGNPIHVTPSREQFLETYNGYGDVTNRTYNTGGNTYSFSYGNDGEVTSKEVFNGKGDLIKTETYDNNQLTGSTFRQYDKNGQMTSEKTYGSTLKDFGGEQRNTYGDDGALKTTSTIDKNGQTVSSEEYNDIGKVAVSKTKDTEKNYSYNETGTITGTETKNKNGQVIEKETYDKDGKISGTEKYDYYSDGSKYSTDTYDKDGNLIKREQLNDKGETFRTVTTDPNTKKTVVEHIENGKKTTEEYTYNEKGKLIKIEKKEYNDKGEVTNTEVSEPNNEWLSRAPGSTVQKLNDSGFADNYSSTDIGDTGKQDRATEDFEDPYKEYYEKAKAYNESQGREFDYKGDGMIHKGEQIATEHHQTMLDNITPKVHLHDNIKYKGQTITYLPGQAIALAGGDSANLLSVEPFRKQYEDNKDKNFLGSGFNPKPGEKWSAIEYAAAAASTGKYSYKDALETAKALEKKAIESGAGTPFGKYKGPYYKGTKVADVAKQLAAEQKSASDKCKELKDRVDEIIAGTDKILEHLENLSGQAKTVAELFNLQAIMGRLENSKANIVDQFPRACASYTLVYHTSNTSEIADWDKAGLPQPPERLSFVEDLSDKAPLSEQLEKGELEINRHLGVEEPKKDPNLKDLKKEMDDAKSNYDSNIASRNNIGTSRPSNKTKVDPITKATIPDTNANAGIQADWDKYNSLAAEWNTKYENAKKEYEKKEKEIEDYRTELNTMFEYTAVILDFANKFDTFTTTFKGFVTEGGGVDGKTTDVYKWLTSDEITNEIHNNLIDAFNDFESLPQITNKSDYIEGTVLQYDDARGLFYVVQGYDPLTGELTIACYDKNWRKVGTDIVVWDQREIAPISAFPEYSSIPPRITIPTPATTTPGKRPDPGPGPKPTIPRTEAPPTPTKPPVPTQAPPQPTPPPPAPTPTIPIYTIPPEPGPNPNPPTPTPTPTPGPYDPNSPHTGLDAIYSTNDTKQSATGLGALAGLAAGAAGLGLTGLIGDKKEDEDEEDDEFFQVNEEEKPLEEEKPEAKEEKHEEETTDHPEFF